MKRLLPPVFDDDEQQFADEVEAFFDAQTISVRGFFTGRGGATRELYRELGRRGWLSMAWPEEFGGQQRSPVYDYVLWNAAAYHRAARPDLGPGIIAHVLVEHGTDDQRQRYLPGVAAGTTCFSLGYSEPEAGSDLTGLRTRATRRDGAYVVTGEKCWTSDAHHADYVWLLCRTGTMESRGRGLTLLIVPLDQPGVTIAPIDTIDGHRLNQVFLDDVVVEDTERVGEEGQAWAIIRGALAIERHIQLLPGRVRRDLDDLVDLVHELDIGGRADVRAAVARLTASYQQVLAASLHTLAELTAGRTAVAEAARTKLLGTQLAQAIPRTALELGGALALDARTAPAFLWRQSVMETIAGGTSEVMLSILAREALGLASSS